MAQRPLVTCPLRVIAGIPVVALRLRGSEPLWAVIDTGFENEILDTDLAKRLRLPVKETHTEAQPGGTVTTTTLHLQTITLGALRVPRVRFSTMPIAGLGMVLGVPMAAILGHTFLRRFVVELDYGAAQLRLWHPDGWRYTGSGSPLPVRFQENQVLVDATLELPSGRRLTAPYKLDTGSLNVAGLALNYVRKESVIEPGIEEIAANGLAVGGDTQARVFRARRFQLGPTVIEQPQLGYVVAAGGFENRAFAGTVGAGAIAHNRLILDYPRRRVFLEPRTGNRPREDLSGMFLVSPAPAFTQLLILTVLPGSAADTAGLKPGDTLLTIDGKPCPLEAARQRLTQPLPVPIRYRRGTSEATVTLTPRLHPAAVAERR